MDSYLKYICESDFDLREPDWLGSQRMKVRTILSVMFREEDLRLCDPQVRVMSTHIGMIGVFVSNLNESIMKSQAWVSPGGPAKQYNADASSIWNIRDDESRTNGLE